MKRAGFVCLALVVLQAAPALAFEEVALRNRVRALAGKSGQRPSARYAKEQIKAIHQLALGGKRSMKLLTSVAKGIFAADSSKLMPAIGEGLKIETPEQAATIALGRNGSDHAVKGLVELLERGSNLPHTLFALELSGTQSKAVKQGLRVRAKGHTQHRAAVFKTLLKLGDYSALHDLAAMVKRPEEYAGKPTPMSVWYEYQEACEALYQLGMEQLGNLARHAMDPISGAARHVLQRLATTERTLLPDGVAAQEILEEIAGR
jgi:hypothetical protein